MTETAAVVEPVEFTCTERDFLDAQRLHHTLSLKGRRFLVVMAVIAAAMVCVSLLGRQGLDGLDLVYGLEGAMFVLCVIAILIALSRLVTLPRAARRQFRQQKELSRPITVGVEPPCIAVTTKNGYARIPTEDFLKWAENGRTILLYRTDRSFHLIPRRAVGDSFRRSLVAELTRAGVPRAGFSNS